MPKAPPPTWLKADDVEDGDIVTIMAEPIDQTAKEMEQQGLKFAKDSIVLPLIRLERTKLLYKWRLNITTWRALYSEFGADNKEWVGRQVILSKVEELIGRRHVTAIYGKPHGNRKIEEFT